ncbi:syntaxin-18 [Biomphalaria glabrata]|uniref:Syntaxin-18 n=1 Tax=Biomphalaria glabrata TaxID=6526 RepID=A0A2C9LXC9_BIOGL|nr:syntaxin-18-like [Biomphalaria glabrata]KAI8789679.1 syntaxin-18 [Biomphalaria glabrata]
MADVTNVFKATVKALKSRNKFINEDLNNEDLSKNILALGKRYESEFQHKAKNLVQMITHLRDFLLENRKKYVNTGSLLSSTGDEMSESERDLIDNNAQDIIKKCKEMIILLKLETDKQKVHPQVKEHRQAVLILLETYLKAICKIYSEQKAVRVKRVVDRKRISKLEPERKYNNLRRTQLKQDLNLNQRIPNGEDKPLLDTESHDTHNKNSVNPALLETTPYNVDTEISPEEAQIFEQENKILYEEMNSMMDEVKQIETQVVEIAKLQEIFTEKILEQDVQINAIANTVVGTTENIKDANEEIREAIKKKAEFRVYILFFLVVCSLSLLFLDWYNN